MSKEIKFTSLNELYKRIYPALNTRKTEFVKMGIDATELDIWNCLKTSIWDNNEELNLYDMVNNILNLTESKIIEYLKKKKV